MSDPAADSPRSGLLAVGNFIVDHVKIIDGWPAEEMLASIESERTSNGGGAFNVLMDLARLRAPFPLEAAGLLGEDDAGRWIIAHCEEHGIHTSQLQLRPELRTSYTDAFTVRSTGRRTFFHHRGANARLAAADIDLKASGARLFYLGYLMLLDTLDTADSAGRSAASRLLESACRQGYTTVVDMVSVAHPGLIAGSRSALPWIDHFVLNEIEAGQLCGRSLRRPDQTLDDAAMEAAALDLLAAGVRDSVTIHAVEGAVSARVDGIVRQRSVALPAGSIQGATGAGDAFAAGWIYALHEGWMPADGLRLGVCAAAACLADPTPSEGVLSMEDCLALGETHGFRKS